MAGEKEKMLFRKRLVSLLLISALLLLPVAAASPQPGSHWGAEYILRAAEDGLLDGLEPDPDPDGILTRGAYVEMLWRLSGRPSPSEASAFPDVPEESAYAAAVNWAAEQNFVHGYPDGLFRPGDPLTREAALRILYDHAGGISGTEILLYSIYDDYFEDSGSISAWARAAVYWSVYHSLAEGTGEGRMAPGEAVTLAQAAKILVRYMDMTK